MPVCSGVPHGSIFWPILFLIYINDLPDFISYKVRLFADETALYLTIECENDSAALQHANDLDKLSMCERDWDMEFNPISSKCQVIQVTRARKPINANYSLHGKVLETVNYAKYLGVDITSDLSWHSHVDRITGKATKPYILSEETSEQNIPA